MDESALWAFDHAPCYEAYYAYFGFSISGWHIDDGVASLHIEDVFHYLGEGFVVPVVYEFAFVYFSEYPFDEIEVGAEDRFFFEDFL